VVLVLMFRKEGSSSTFSSLVGSRSALWIDRVGVGVVLSICRYTALTIVEIVHGFDLRPARRQRPHVKVRVGKWD